MKQTEPCKLVLSLKQGGERCPTCGWLAGSHRNWDGYASAGRDRPWEEYWAEEEPVEEPAEAPQCPAAPPEDTTEDLKPRGTKAQFWLAVYPRTIRELLVLAKQPAMRVEAALDHHIRDNGMQGEESTLQLARALLEELARRHGGQYQALCKAVEVFQFGADKYAPGNFRRAFSDMESMRREYTSAISRHVWEDRFNGPIDQESGLEHLAHAFCGCLMLLEGEMEHHGW